MRSWFDEENELKMLLTTEESLLDAFRKKDEKSIHSIINDILQNVVAIHFSSPSLLNETLWHTARYKDSIYLNFMIFLLKRGADVNAIFDNQTPLFVAIIANNTPAIKLLLDHQAKVFSIAYQPNACSLEEFLFQMISHTHNEFPYPPNFFIDLSNAFVPKFKNQECKMDETQITVWQKISTISPHSGLRPYFEYIFKHTQSNKLSLHHYWVLYQAFGSTLPLLFETIAKGTSADLERLLLAGANCNITISLKLENEVNSLVTPLSFAFYLHQAVMVEILLKHGAKLPVIAKKNNEKMIFSSLGSFISHPFLIQAAANGCVETIRFTLASDYSNQASDLIKMKDVPEYEYVSDGKSNVLKQACESNQAKIVQILLSMGFNNSQNISDNTQDILKTLSPLHLAAFFPGNSDEMLKILSSDAKDINKHDKNGLTPLHYAVLGNNLAAIDILFKHEANLYAEDNRGKTIFDYAVLTGNVEIFTHLKKTYQPNLSTDYKSIEDDDLKRQAYFYSIMTQTLYSIPRWENNREYWYFKFFSKQFWNLLHFYILIDILDMNLQGLHTNNKDMFYQLTSFIIKKTAVAGFALMKIPFVLTDYILLSNSSDNRKNIILKRDATVEWVKPRRYVLPLHEILAWLGNLQDRHEFLRINYHAQLVLISWTWGNENALSYFNIPLLYHFVLIKRAQTDREVIDMSANYQLTPKVLTDIDRTLKNFLPLLQINKAQQLHPRLPRAIGCHIASFLAEIKYPVKDRGLHSSHWRTLPNLFDALQKRAKEVLAKVNHKVPPRFLDEYRKVRNEFLLMLLPRESGNYCNNWPVYSWENFTYQMLEKASNLVSFEKSHPNTNLKELLKKEHENKNEGDVSKEIKKQIFQLEQYAIDTIVNEKSYAIAQMIEKKHNARIDRYLGTSLPLKQELYALAFFKHERCQYYSYPTERENFLRTLFNMKEPEQAVEQAPKKRKK